MELPLNFCCPAKHVWVILVTTSIMLPNLSVWFDMQLCAQVSNCDN
jgi:hypothetical protein